MISSPALDILCLLGDTRWINEFLKGLHLKAAELILELGCRKQRANPRLFRPWVILLTQFWISNKQLLTIDDFTKDIEKQDWQTYETYFQWKWLVAYKIKREVSIKLTTWLDMYFRGKLNAYLHTCTVFCNWPTKVVWFRNIMHYWW